MTSILVLFLIWIFIYKPDIDEKLFIIGVSEEYIEKH